MQDGGERTDDDRVQKPIHLLPADHHDGPYLANLSAYGGIEVGKVNSISLGKGHRQSRPSATVTSRSFQSSCSTAMH